jgi:hypothetical protein
MFCNQSASKIAYSNRRKGIRPLATGKMMLSRDVAADGQDPPLTKLSSADRTPDVGHVCFHHA